MYVTVSINLIELYNLLECRELECEGLECEGSLRVIIRVIIQ